MIIALYVILAIIAVIILLAVIAPKSYNVSRSVVINKSIAEVFNYLKYIKNQDDWSPWKKKDPDMKQTFTGTDGEVGFISRWEGNKDVGVGEQELTGITENSSVESQLRFSKQSRANHVSEEVPRVAQPSPKIYRRQLDVKTKVVT